MARGFVIWNLKVESEFQESTQEDAIMINQHSLCQFTSKPEFACMCRCTFKRRFFFILCIASFWLDAVEVFQCRFHWEEFLQICGHAWSNLVVPCGCVGVRVLTVKFSQSGGCFVNEFVVFFNFVFQWHSSANCTLRNPSSRLCCWHGLFPASVESRRTPAACCRTKWCTLSLCQREVQMGHHKRYQEFPVES